jgi:hypothetical protein
MDRQQVISTLDSLAAGSVIGEDTVRALRVATTLLKESGPRNPKLPAAGTPWSHEEDTRLGSEFDSGMTIAQIALQHGRTSGGITQRLVKLGKIDPATVKTRERGSA